MDHGIIDYCLQDSPFFDVQTTTAADYDHTGRVLPAGWVRTTDDTWSYQHPVEVSCREQGWKIHVSAVPEDGEKVLDIVWDYCLRGRVPFKFLRSRRQLVARNSKYGDRTASGKFVAVYPPAEDDLATILADLDVLLAGFRGPAVLTDLRYGAAPVFVRYGAFIEMVGAGPQGLPVPCIRHPDGTLVPDLRRPVFRTPDWVDIPTCLAESVRRRNAGGTPLPARVVRALHFSNGGGVYEAVNRASGDRVLLKEARPDAGLDEEGRDAVARLEREAWALEKLAGAAYVPALVDFRRGHEHYYLAREFVAGESLLTEMQRRHPFLPGQGLMAPREYAAWAVDICDRVDEALSDMHGRGVAFGDVHPNNILLTDAGELAFIDLETATPVQDNEPQRIGAPGFRAPGHLGGALADRYALGCLRLALLLPSTIVLSWGEGKGEELLAEIHRTFDGPEGELSVIPPRFDDVVRRDLQLALGAGVGPAAGDGVVSALGAHDDATDRFTLDQATPNRTDRLYPGAANQFRTPGGGVTVAYGAAGVLWALHQRGMAVPSEHVEWFVQRAVGTMQCAPGLFEGSAGVALVAHHLGHADEARALLERALDEASVDPSIVRGSSGVGVAALLASPWYAEGRAAAHDIGARLLGDEAWTRMTTRRGTPSWGLLDGPSGVALFLVRLFEHSGDRVYLEAAGQALRVDLDRLFLGDGWRSDLGSIGPGPWQRATLHRGSAGTAMVAADYLDALRACGAEDPAVNAALERLGTVHDLWHHEQPGLFTGRTGMIAALRHVGDRWPDRQERVARQLRLLRLHAVRGSGVTGYLGDHGLKMSCDLATGSTGVTWVARGGSVPFCFPGSGGTRAG